MNKGSDAGLLAQLTRKRQRVHPSNRQPDLPIAVKMTFGDLETIIRALTKVEDTE